MRHLLASLPWFTTRHGSSWSLRLAPRRRIYRCLVLDTARHEVVECTALSPEEAAKTVAWEALTEEAFEGADTATITIQILGEDAPRRFRFSRRWRLDESDVVAAAARNDLRLAG
jgi:hypothetical protein